MQSPFNPWDNAGAPARQRPPTRLLHLALLVAATTLCGAVQAQQLTVRTIGGGRAVADGPDNGFVDGNILQTSQFDTPLGCAVDAFGNVYVADSRNGALRKLDLAGNRSSTVLERLADPVAVVTGGTNDFYILTRGDGTIRRLDRFDTVTVVATGLVSPTALAYDERSALYATEESGRLVQINLAGKTSAVVATGLLQPGGVAVLRNGNIAVSETGGNRVLFIRPSDGARVSQIGTGVAGFANGPATVAKFLSPHHLARTATGGLVVADTGNQRVRAIDPEGFVTTVYGVDPSLWEGPQCLTCAPAILPGWLDGSTQFAEAREPYGVALGANGKLYTTEDYYHLVREITGFTGGTGGTGSGGTTGTNLTVLAPLISPDTGYFPVGQLITISNPNHNDFLPNRVFYTTDGSEPTTNSVELAMTNGVGSIVWAERLRDLTSLRVRAYIGESASPVTSGRASLENVIDFPRDAQAGPGSTIVLPVVVSLRTNQNLKSLQFRAEVRPTSASVPKLQEGLRALAISTNDFVTVTTSDHQGGASLFSSVPYENGRASGIAVTFLGTDANLSVKDFATVAMLAIPIPTTAKFGDEFDLQIISPSGTSDAAETPISLSAGPARRISVAPVSYTVGDSSPGRGYNADSTDSEDPFRIGFGDGQLNNSDVNNALAASLGVRLPYVFTDVFNALDVFPEDTDTAVGGDGLIRFLDWQLILFKSLGLDDRNWERYWDEGGVRRARRKQGGGFQTSGFVRNTLQPSRATPVWNPQVLMRGVTLTNLEPGVVAKVPVYLDIADGAQLAGLEFRAVIEPSAGAPAIDRQVEFETASGLPNPAQKSNLALNDFFCAWSLVAPFNPVLKGTNLLGYIKFVPSAFAQAGQSYTVRFSNADGAPDLQTQYDFETRSAGLWIRSAELTPISPISDEWKTFFFGSRTNVLAAPDADPDKDGVSNLSEYLAGTNPTNAVSSLRLEGATASGDRHGFTLRWLSAPGKKYSIEQSLDTPPTQWGGSITNLNGTGGYLEWTDPSGDSGEAVRFYRLRVQ